MGTRYFEHQYDNGLQLLVEPMKSVQSAAFTFLIPAGVSREPAEFSGTANLLTSLVTRGAGPRDNREISTALDNLGVQRGENTEIHHACFTAASLACNLVPALDILRDILCSPHLAEEELEFCKMAALQELHAIEDEPAQKAFLELKQMALPDPLGRRILGTEESVLATGLDVVRSYHKTAYRPEGAILGIAGAVDFETVRDQIGRLFADWEGKSPPLATVPARTPSHRHVDSDKAQTHMGIAFDSVAYGDPDFFKAHGAVGVLGGGMSARLFTEVREKRGLCYSVGASYFPLKDRGLVIGHASSTNERAQETLDVMLSEFQRLREGISDNEVDRVKAGLKSSLIMQEESTSARASILARGWHYLGRVRSLEEVSQEVDALTPANILEYLERHPPGEYNILTLGPKPLEVRS